MRKPFALTGLVAFGLAVGLAAVARAELVPVGAEPKPAALTVSPLADPPDLIILLPKAQPQPAAAFPVPDPSLPPPLLVNLLNEALKTALESRMANEALAGKASPFAANRHKERDAIVAYYASRQFAPLWIVDGKFNAAAHVALIQLKHASDDGLELHDTPLPDLLGTNLAQMIGAEIDLSEAVVNYAHQASGGRVDPQKIAQLITAKPEFVDAAIALGKTSAAGDSADTMLASFNPPHSGYLGLRSKLAELRAGRATLVSEKIPLGPILRVGMRDPRVPLIRARFGLDAAPALDSADFTYDARSAGAIAEFQRANGLPASGIVTARTIAALSGGEPSRLENEILANMERWRWLPRDMGQQRIEVNIPDFTVKVMDRDIVTHRARVVVGKPDTPTPIFSKVMQFLIVNPYWNVPPSIIKKEMIPRLAQDPDYLRRLGFEVVHRGNNLIVRQPPGERNALGRIKFMFPNEHSVYLHDTPSRALFANERRAFSHGCVRVDQPFALATTLLGPAWSEARIKGLIGGAERTIYLPKPLQIHIEYFTAGVDETGRLQLRDDIYGYSRRLKTAMGLED